MAALLPLLSAGAGAQVLHGTSETMINMFPDPVQRELRIVAPFVQWVTLRAEKLADADLAVQLSGWGGFDLGNAWFPGRGGGELSLAHLSWRDPRRGVSVTLGRQYLLLGLARAEHFDGLHLGKDLPAGFRVEIFGGEHAGPRLTYQPGDWLVGGRLSHRWGNLVTSGISFLQAREGEVLRRELIGADVTVRPRPWVELGAGALHDVIGDHLAQLDLFGSFFPVPGLRVLVDWRRVVPVALLDKTSIFSVFSDAVRNEVGGEVSFRAGRALTLGADGHALAFDEGQRGYRAGAGARIALDRRERSVLVLRVARWRDATDGYWELRAAVRRSFTDALFGVLDIQTYRYDVGVRGERLSFGTTAAVGYDVTRRIRALLAVEAGVTPQFDRRAQLLAKLEYNFLTAF